jgi:hypothetical protein
MIHLWRNPATRQYGLRQIERPDGTFVHWAEIEDKAARYLEEQHLLKINADFRVFTDMIEHWVDVYSKEHGPAPGLRETVRDAVHNWYEQALTETIIGLQALRGSKEWPTNLLQDAWSESALTAVVMQRYHPFNSIKRELGTKVAPLKKQAANA